MRGDPRSLGRFVVISTINPPHLANESLNDGITPVLDIPARICLLRCRLFFSRILRGGIWEKGDVCQVAKHPIFPRKGESRYEIPPLR
jgi:hypothetical protein